MHDHVLARISSPSGLGYTTHNTVKGLEDGNIGGLLSKLPIRQNKFPAKFLAIRYLKLAIGVLYVIYGMRRGVKLLIKH